MNDLQKRLMTGMTALLVAGIIKLLVLLGVDPKDLDAHTMDVVATAILSGGIGWATKHWSDWGGPKDPPPPAVPSDVGHELAVKK